MPTYDIEAPNGKVFNIEAPEGATDEQLFGYVQQLLNQPTPIDPKEEGTAKLNLVHKKQVLLDSKTLKKPKVY